MDILITPIVISGTNAEKESEESITGEDLSPIIQTNGEDRISSTKQESNIEKDSYKGEDDLKNRINSENQEIMNQGESAEPSDMDERDSSKTQISDFDDNCPEAPMNNKDIFDHQERPHSYDNLEDRMVNNSKRQTSIDKLDSATNRSYSSRLTRTDSIHDDEDINIDLYTTTDDIKSSQDNTKLDYCLETQNQFGNTAEDDLSESEYSEQNTKETQQDDTISDDIRLKATDAEIQSSTHPNSEYSNKTQIDGDINANGQNEKGQETEDIISETDVCSIIERKASKTCLLPNEEGMMEGRALSRLSMGSKVKCENSIS